MKRRYDVEKWVFDNPIKFYGGQIVYYQLTNMELFLWDINY
jgi:hypothetical protein